MHPVYVVKKHYNGKNENIQNDTNIFLKLIDKDIRGKRKQNESNTIKNDIFDVFLYHPIKKNANLPKHVSSVVYENTTMGKANG